MNDRFFKLSLSLSGFILSVLFGEKLNSTILLSSSIIFFTCFMYFYLKSDD